MSYLTPASGTPRDRSDTGIYKLESFNIKRDNNTYTFIPELAIAYKNPTPDKKVEISSEAYWHVRDNYVLYEKDKINDATIDRVFVVPTGYCEGGCKYCYAKSAWGIKEYITPEIFDETCRLNGITTLKDVIIYGGEPVYNVHAFHTLIKHFLFKWKAESIVVSTGLFYDDETFNEFKKIVTAYPQRLEISISVDPPATKEDGYMRRYKGNDTYAFLLKRVFELMEITDCLGIRMTINKWSDDPFKLLDAIEFQTGKRLSASIQPLTHGDVSLEYDRLQEIKQRLSSYMNDEIYSGKRKACRETVPNPIGRMMINRGLPWIHSMKDCDMYTARLSIMPDGGISDCSEVVALKRDRTETKSKCEIHDRAFKNDNKECAKCDWKAVCGKRCFDFIDSKNFAKNYKVSCEYLIHAQMLSVELFVKTVPTEELDAFCELSQKIAGISFV